MKTRLRINIPRLWAYQSNFNFFLPRPMSCLSRPCRVSQEHFMLFKTMSFMLRSCHVCFSITFKRPYQDHVEKTNIPIWSNLILLGPVWTSLSLFDPIWFSLIQFDLFLAYWSKCMQFQSNTTTTKLRTISMYKTAVHGLAVKKGIIFDQVFQING